jgi:hypothetical protein
VVRGEIWSLRHIRYLRRRFGEILNPLAILRRAHTLFELRTIVALGGWSNPLWYSYDYDSRTGAWVGARFPEIAVGMVYNVNTRASGNEYREFSRAVARRVPKCWALLVDGELHVHVKASHWRHTAKFLPARPRRMCVIL